MKRVFRVAVAPDAPIVQFSPAEPYCKILRDFDGGSLATYVPTDGTFRATLSTRGEWNQFYYVSPGCFAISEESWEHCMDLYYLLEYGDIEIPWIVTEECDLRLINPLQVLPALSEASVLDANKLFRVSGKPPDQIFCLEGTAVPGDEFKSIYDKFGFRGLVFHEELFKEALP